MADPVGGPPPGEDGEARIPRQRVAVYGICKDPEGRILLTRAAAYLTVAGRWFLPGGGIDHGEEPESALRREFTEETGLEVEVGELLGVLSDVFPVPDGDVQLDLHTVRIIYAVRSYRGQLRDEQNGSTDAARWVLPHDALDLPLVRYVRRALTELR